MMFWLFFFQQVPSSVQDPLVWLRLAKAYAQAGATSLASICYAQCAALLPNSQDPKVMTYHQQLLEGIDKESACLVAWLNAG
jgi:hypothetical protein